MVVIITIMHQFKVTRTDGLEKVGVSLRIYKCNWQANQIKSEPPTVGLVACCRWMERLKTLVLALFWVGLCSAVELDFSIKLLKGLFQAVVSCLYIYYYYY